MIGYALHPLLLLLVVLLVQPNGVFAQELTGRVVDRESGAPIAGAVVELLAPDSTRVRVALSREDGSYVLRIGGGGSHLLRVGAMGYASRVVGPLDAPDAGGLDLVLVPAPVPLEGITATAGSHCVARPGDAGQTARLWEQIQAALDVTQIAQDQELFQLELLRFLRELVPTGQYLSHEEAELWTGAQPFRGVPLARVLEVGFIDERGRQLEYFVPTPAIILSDGFRERHCFHVETRMQDGRRLLGLAFAPLEDRTSEEVVMERRDEALPVRLSATGLLDPRGADVEGVLWVDTGTGHLEWLEYEYVGIELPEGSPPAGGYTRFERLPNGLWVVRRWVLRMPTLVVGRQSGTFDLGGIREEGGQLVRATQREGDRVPLSPGVEVRGRVLVEGTSTPVPGALVRLSGTPVTSESGADGSFTLEGVIPGPHLASAYLPVLDSLGVPHPALAVDVTARSRPLVLPFPDRAKVLDYLCPRIAADDGHLLVITDPLPEEGHVDVRVSAPYSGGSWRRRSDEQGRVRFCGVPEAEPLEVRATWPGGGTAADTTHVSSRLGLLVLRGPEQGPRSGASR